MKQIGNTLGKEFFEGLAALMSVGFQAYDDWDNQNLSGGQKLGRASVAIFDMLPPVGIAHIGADILFPGAWNKTTAYAFSPSAPWIQFLSDQMNRRGGPGFQHWLMKQTWLEFQ